MPEPGPKIAEAGTRSICLKERSKLSELQKARKSEGFGTYASVDQDLREVVGTSSLEDEYDEG